MKDLLKSKLFWVATIAVLAAVGDGLANGLEWRQMIAACITALSFTARRYAMSADVEGDIDAGDDGVE